MHAPEPQEATAGAGDLPDKAPAGLGSDGNRRRLRRWLRLGWLGVLYSSIALMVLISVQLIRYTIQFPDPRALTVSEAGPTVRVLGRDGSVIAERGERNDFLALDRMPRHLVNAVVAIEDRRFFAHSGLDPSGMARAFFANLRAGRSVQGGSTITQQLAKNLFLSTDKTLARKLEELVLAVWLELRLTKRQILELYLNRVYFGGGAYGVEAAARRFFDKPARAVTVAEAAVIAGLLKAPSKFSPFANPGHARARARVVLRSMRAAGLLSPVAEATAVRQSVRFADPEAGKAASGLEYAIDYVLDRLPPIASVGRREIVVETTIDPRLQKVAQAAVEDLLAKEGKSSSVGQAALVVLDTSGGIRALVGGRSFAESQFNRAVKARRQPGSVFKPLVYLTAIEQGVSGDAVIADQPIDIGGWSPRNEDGRYRGPITLRTAMAHSINTVAVRLQEEVGVQRVVSVASRLGIGSKLRPDPSLALGTSEVGLLELTGAYGVLAAGGAAVEPHAIARVRVGDGPMLYERPRSGPRMIVAPDVVGTMNTLLNAVVVSGTGRRAALPRHQAAGKTGTSQDFRDAWFVGYTAHLAGGVWLGNDDGTPMNRVAGGGLPAELWRTVMAAAHERLAPASLPAIDPTRPETPAPPVSAPAGKPALAATSRTRGSSPQKEAPPRAKSDPVSAAAKPLPRDSRPAPVKLPAESIDPALFEQALAAEPNAPAPARAASAVAGAAVDEKRTPVLDIGRIRDALGGFSAGRDPRMGLGMGRHQERGAEKAE
jgi:penicillin-binding protein 1A